MRLSLFDTECSNKIEEGLSLKKAVTKSHWRPRDSYYFCSDLNYFPFFATSTLPWRSGEVIEKQLLHQESNFFPSFCQTPLGNIHRGLTSRFKFESQPCCRLCTLLYQWRPSLHSTFWVSCDQISKFSVCPRNMAIWTYLSFGIAIQLSSAGTRQLHWWCGLCCDYKGVKDDQVTGNTMCVITRQSVVTQSWN